MQSAHLQESSSRYVADEAEKLGRLCLQAAQEAGPSRDAGPAEPDAVDRLTSAAHTVIVEGPSCRQRTRTNHSVIPDGEG